MILNDKTIRFLIKDKGLISDYVDLSKQIQPNGFDLTLREVMTFSGAGQLDFSNMQRKIPFAEHLSFSNDGWLNLKPGAYLVTTNEYLRLPRDIIAIAFPRTSLLRMGAYTHHGVWDAGFEGRSQFLLVVNNPHGIKLQKDARIAQLVFLKLSEEVEKEYDGIYKRLV